MANRKNGTIYLGTTSDLPKRAWRHRISVIEGFTNTYGCQKLAWDQAFDSLEATRQRELQMKKWKRAWKLREIEALNPDWDDLFETLAPT